MPPASTDSGEEAWRGGSRTSKRAPRPGPAPHPDVICRLSPFRPKTQDPGWAEERVLRLLLHQEMQRSLLEYAMSVIVGRAFPDVRDGSSRWQRRVPHSRMQEAGAHPDGAYRQSAPGWWVNVLGQNTHPQRRTQAVYDALVRMAQTFLPAVTRCWNGHGNFGSVDDDPPAAMPANNGDRLAADRQTRACSTKSASDSARVRFCAEFRRLPSRSPPCCRAPAALLVASTAAAGIAVGHATKLPPHNLAEVVEALIALIRNRRAQRCKLLELGCRGPRFSPPAGEVLNRQWCAGHLSQRAAAASDARRGPYRGRSSPAKGRQRRGAL